MIWEFFFRSIQSYPARVQLPAAEKWMYTQLVILDGKIDNHWVLLRLFSNELEQEKVLRFMNLLKRRSGLEILQLKSTRFSKAIS